MTAVLIIIGLIVLLVFFVIQVFNRFVKNKNMVKDAWSNIDVALNRRYDLIPNLVQTVKGYASHEKEVLTEVTEARAKVGSVNVTTDQLDDPNAVQRYMSAQSDLTSALSRLLVVTENYPQLKADGLFQDLMVQLEGTENRITVARGRYVTAIQDYNLFIRKFPTLITAKIFGYKTKENFKVENEKAISTAPTVSFN